MTAIIPIISAIGAGLSIGQTVAPGLFGGSQSTDLPAFDAQTNSTQIDDELSSQNKRSMELRRLASSRSRSLTNIQDNPVDPDSLLRIISEQ